MINMKYVSSNQKEYGLIGKKMRVTDGSFHSYQWTEDTTDMEVGSKVYGFKKEPVTITLTWTFRGDLNERKQMLDEITEAFENDIVNLKPGRFGMEDIT